MENRNVYEQLAAHLNQWVIGTPMSPALMEILRILFPGEEAEVACRLPLEGKTLTELKSLYPEHAGRLAEILERMVAHGTVYTSQKPGGERKYRLLPSVVGWAETPFWAGRPDERNRRLAPLWIRYRQEAFGAELARGGMPVMRVVPEAGTLRDDRQVLPFDELEKVVAQVSFRAVAHCPCRQMRAYAGEGCGHPLENCLHFGSMGRYMVERGLAREVTAEETLDILREANREGLVHLVDNLEGHVSTVCNCCGCCCVFLDTQKKLGVHTTAAANYVAEVSAEQCLGCGTCEQRCPMGAIAVDEQGVAVVRQAACLGCGVCQPTCEAQAVALVRRGKVEAPPDLGRFLTARLARGEVSSSG